MINDNDHIEAIFLVARYGREASEIADHQRMEANDRGDRTEARRWRGIHRLLRRTIAPAQPVPLKVR